MDTRPTWDWSAAADAASDKPEPNPIAERSSRPYAGTKPPEPSVAEESGAEWSHAGDVPAAEPAPAEPPTTEPPPAGPQGGPKRRRYGPRSCRICLDSEQPKFPTDITTTLGISSVSSRPEYVSDDPELGRLLSPCKCKGSQKYVHEGCLNAWRLANPTAGRNYWQCPTCGFTYRMVRLQYASMLSSRMTQVALTLLILVVSIFILGFVADGIFDLWLDPVGTISDTVTNVVSDIEALHEPPPSEPTTWAEHFLKGFFSLGLVGFLKSMIAMSPFHWWNLRSSGMLGAGRREGGGRARVENMNILLVLLGAFTFLMATWKVVKSLSARLLKGVSERVLDVGVDDDFEEVDEDESKKDQ